MRPAAGYRPAVAHDDDQLNGMVPTLKRSAAALRAERIVAYQHSSVRFVHTGNLANDVVISFRFNYCRFKFSRFD